MATIEVCDVCRDRMREVDTYQVGHGQEAVTVELCTEHARPLEELLALGTPTRRTSPKAKLWSIEEIEQLKTAKAQRKG